MRRGAPGHALVMRPHMTRAYVWRGSLYFSFPLAEKIPAISRAAVRMASSRQRPAISTVSLIDPTSPLMTVASLKGGLNRSAQEARQASPMAS